MKQRCAEEVLPEEEQKKVWECLLLLEVELQNENVSAKKM